MNEHDGLYDITWEWPVFLSQLFAFAVIVGALRKWVMPQVRTVMHKAQNTIRDQLEESSQAAAQLAAAEKAFADAITTARAEVELIEHEAHHDAERIIAALRDTAAFEVERVRHQGAQHVSTVRAQLKNDLVHELTNTVFDRTEAALRELLTSPAARSDSVDRFLEGLAT